MLFAGWCWRGGSGSQGDAGDAGGGGSGIHLWREACSFWRGIVMGFDPARRNRLGAFGMLGLIILVIMYLEVVRMVVVVVADGRCGAIVSGGSNFRPGQRGPAANVG